MNTFVNMYEEQRELLKAKGYTETALNSFDKEGWLLRQLQLNLAEAIRDAHQYKKPCRFDLKTIGFFNEDRDIIHFTLNYQYDPEKQQLNLRSLEVRTRVEQYRTHLKHNGELPFPVEIHQRYVSSERFQKMLEKVHDTSSGHLSTQQHIRL